jgi:serine protease
MKSCNYLKSKWLLKSLFVFMILTISLFSCKKDSVDIKDTSTQISDVNNDIYTVEEVRTLFDQKKPLDWKTEKDAKFIYSVGVHTDPIYSVGYKPKNITNLMEIIHLIDIHSDEWKNVEDKVMDELLKNEGKKKSEVLIHHFDPLPSFVVQGLSLSTIEKLIAMDEVMYVEPKTTTIFAPGYSKVNLREDGNDLLPFETDPLVNETCNCGEDNTVNPLDFQILSPDTKQSWHFIESKINNVSWGISTGTGIGIAILDTGVSDDQENLYAYKFGYTWPYERNHYRYNFLPTISPNFIKLVFGDDNEDPLIHAANPNRTHDYCGHGTRMAGIATAPRGNNGSAVGVAYGADLHSMRVAHNPIIDIFTEKMALTAAIMSAKENPGIQIISISLGMIPGLVDSDIEMAIQAAYNTDEKLIFCAAGSSNYIAGTSVVFPANLFSTLAVTGIQQQNVPGPLSSSDQQCDICHYGPEVDFSVVMQKTFDPVRTAVGLNCSNNVPVYTSGSSAATATMAGIAALIWAKNGVNTLASDIEVKLIQSASNDIKHSTLGFGWVDAEFALGL